MRFWCRVSFIGVLLLGQACTEAPPTARNVILLSVDTLRADRLGCYGYGRPTSPQIDGIAARGVRFERAFAGSSWTLPTHMSMLTGLPPGQHRVNGRKNELSPQIPTMAEILGRAGFRTHAVTCDGFVGTGWGLERGFGVYDARLRSVSQVLDAGRSFIAGLADDERYFLFLHTYSVHSPYNPKKASRTKFVRHPEDHFKGARTRPLFNASKLTQRQIGYLSDLYDATISESDAAIGEFFAWLEERGALRDTVFILVSDHGEEFGEHGRLGHGKNLYVETLRVPLIIVAPGFEPAVVEGRTALSDLMPTSLELLGVDGPEVSGQSLLAPMRSAEELPEREMLGILELKDKGRSLLRDRYHLVVGNGDERALFDLAADPEEKSPLADPAVLQRMSESMKRLFERAEVGPSKEAVRLSPEVIERLRALGYENDS